MTIQQVPSVWGASFTLPLDATVLKMDLGGMSVFYNLPGSLAHATPGKLQLIPFGKEFKLQLIASGNGMEIQMHPYGLHPCYYYQHQGRFAFASSIRKLLECFPGLQPRVNPDALIHLYCFGFEPAGQSLLEGIRKLEAGQRLHWNQDGSLSIQNGYNWPVGNTDSPRRWDETELALQIDETFARCLAELSLPQGAVGISLSGGVDSGYTCVHLKNSGAEIKAYTMLYGKQYSETSRIGLLEKELRLTVKRLELNENEVRSNFEAVNQCVSSPCGFNNATLNLLFREAGQEGVQQLFDGDGADRLFLGMNRYLQLQKVLRVFIACKRLGLLGFLLPVLQRGTSAQLRKTYTLFMNWNRGLPPYVERIYEALPYRDGFEDYLFNLAVARNWEYYLAQDPQSNWMDDPFRFISHFAVSKCPEMFFHHPAELQLIQNINATPAFWHPDMVRLAFEIPTSLKLRQRTTKYILRKAAATRLLPDYWQLPKIGLQSSFKFATSSSDGIRWLRQWETDMESTFWFRELEQKLGVRPDYSRLVSFHLWYISLPRS